MATSEELAEVTGIDPDTVAFLRDADEAEVRELIDAVHEARRRRDEELRAALDRALGVVPRPLRGRVRRLLGGGRARG